MTLNTKIWLHGPVHGREAFRLALSALLVAANPNTASKRIATAQIEERAASSVPNWVLDREGLTPEQIDHWRNDYDEIGTVLGQGLPGIVDCDYREDGSPLATEDIYDDEDGDEEPYVVQRKSQVALSWDTSYGYSENGLTCTSLHAKALVLLHELLKMYEAVPGVTLTWQNEYTGEVYEGLDGLAEWLNGGDEAMNWFTNTAKPAIEAMHPDIQWTTGS